jgi:thiol-disulfide isomerase/thioredoxin
VEAIFVLVKRHFLFLLFLLVVALSYAGVRYALEKRHNVQYAPQEKQATVGESPRPQEIYFYDKSGNRITLDQFAGKVVLLNLWATWCEPCITEMPALDRLQSQLPRDQFRVVAVSLDRSSRQKVEDFMQEKGLGNLDLYWDQDRQVPLKWKYEALPTSYLIDRKGEIVAQYNGPYEWDKEPLVGNISKLLAQ